MAPDADLPQLIHLPLLIADCLSQQQQIPNEVHSKVGRVVTSQGVAITASDAKLVLDWCIGASQPDAKR